MYLEMSQVEDRFVLKYQSEDMSVIVYPIHFHNFYLGY